MQIKNVVFDVDGVLFDIHSSLERVLKAKNEVYSINNVKTFDFNKSLSREARLQLGISEDDLTNGLGVSRSLIYDYLTDGKFFKGLKPFASVIRDIELLKRICDSSNTSLHSSAGSLEVFNAKSRQLNDFLNEYDLCASLSLILTGDVYKASLVLNPMGEREVIQFRGCSKKPALVADFVVEDCLENLAMYSDDTVKILVDNPYNKEEFNTWYTRFDCPDFIRVYSTSDAFDLILKFL